MAGARHASSSKKSEGKKVKVSCLFCLYTFSFLLFGVNRRRNRPHEDRITQVLAAAGDLHSIGHPFCCSAQAVSAQSARNGVSGPANWSDSHTWPERITRNWPVDGARDRGRRDGSSRTM